MTIITKQCHPACTLESSASLLKTCRAFPVVLAFLISWVSAYAQCTSRSDGLTAAELLRRVVDHELSAQSDDHSHRMYQVTESSLGSEQVKFVVETSGGTLNRLVSVNGQPIPPEQGKREN